MYHPWLSGMDLMYMHDDSENMEDTFTVQLTDGRHQLHRHVMVKVLPVNDEEPRVIRLNQHPQYTSCLKSAVTWLKVEKESEPCLHLLLLPSGTMDWRWSRAKPGSFPVLHSSHRTAILLHQRSCTYLRVFLPEDCFSLRLVQCQSFFQDIHQIFWHHVPCWSSCVRWWEPTESSIYEKMWGNGTLMIVSKLWQWGSAWRTKIHKSVHLQI